jgi:hypothetical protein
MHYLFRACSRLFRVKLNHAVPLTLLSLIFRDVAFIHSSKVFERLAQLEAVHRIRQVLHADSVARGRGAPSLILFNLLASLNHKGLGRSSHLVVVATHLWGLQILVRVVPVRLLVIAVVITVVSALFEARVGREISAIAAGE